MPLGCSKDEHLFLLSDPVPDRVNTNGATFLMTSHVRSALSTLHRYFLVLKNVHLKALLYSSIFHAAKIFTTQLTLFFSALLPFINIPAILRECLNSFHKLANSQEGEAFTPISKNNCYFLHLSWYMQRQFHSYYKESNDKLDL